MGSCKATLRCVGAAPVLVCDGSEACDTASAPPPPHTHTALYLQVAACDQACVNAAIDQVQARAAAKCAAKARALALSAKASKASKEDQQRKAWACYQDFLAGIRWAC